VPHFTDTWKQIVTSGDTVALVNDDGTVVARYPESPATAAGRSYGRSLNANGGVDIRV